jgi:excinuclease ABC subunit A
MLLPEKSELSYFSKQLMDVETGLAYDKPAPNLFSFNSPRGYCPSCRGLGTIHRISQQSVIPDPSLSIAKGGIAPLGPVRDIWIFKKIKSILNLMGENIKTPISELPDEVIKILLEGSDEKVEVPSVKYPGTSWKTSFEGIINFMQKQRDGGTQKMRTWVEEFMEIKVCEECKGTRLRKQALFFKVGGKNIAELAQMDIKSLGEWVSTVEERMDERQILIGAEVLKEIRKRIGFLLDVGLNYLSLDRPLRTLSGGEAQRIRLATQIGTQLVGVLYIMDEPSIGLHQRDNHKLINALKDLRDLGNSVIVVEHDKDMMLASDFLIDIGPGAGVHGGHIVAAGTPAEVLQVESETSSYLSGRKRIEVPARRRKGNGDKIILKGAVGNNLRKVNAEFPLGKMICVTGVSGSGKSTLIHDTLYPLLHSHVYRTKKKSLDYKSIKGLEKLDKVIEVDQSPIGRTPRSNPATYTGLFTHIRALFAALPEAKIRGYKPGRFSFNVKGGRCETCQGGGLKTVEMDFLPNVYVICEDCKGKRYNRETLEVRFKGKSIADVLDMTVETALDFFEFQPRIRRIVQTLYQVGLGYISLGQHATTLSGGEAQRVKLSTELSKRDTGQTFYILDEPSTGLHFEDIRKLMEVLSQLVDKGNTVLIIEHNLDIIKLADHIIDIGPEGGTEGGEIVATGTPEEVINVEASHTGFFLKEELKKDRV